MRKDVSKPMSARKLGFGPTLQSWLLSERATRRKAELEVEEEAAARETSRTQIEASEEPTETIDGHEDASAKARERKKKKLKRRRIERKGNEV